MTRMQTQGSWYYPPAWLVVGSLILLLVTLRFCYGNVSAQPMITTHPDFSLFLGAVDDMDHREGAAFALTLLRLYE